jgi:penicillin-binding protein 1C
MGCIVRYGKLGQWPKTWKIIFWCGASLVLLICCGICWPVQIPPLSNVASIKITDRNGLLLREVFSPASGRGTIISVDQASSEYISVLLTLEDKRFYSHFGIDPVAIAHAIYTNIRAGRIVRGGSTITQQLARNLHPRRRTIAAKMIEAWEAIRMEAHWTKTEILTQYINRISFGNNNFGVEAASRFYFGKSAGNLTISEAAFLVSLPKNPTKYNPSFSGYNFQKKRHRQVVNRLLTSHSIDSADYTRALLQFPQVTIHHDIIKAPHFTNWVLSRGPQMTSLVKTSLDLSLQQSAEEIAGRWVDECAQFNVTNAAVVVLDNSTGEILCYVGSADFWDYAHDGEVDGVCALRQPGSSIKPFTYALALANGFTAATVLPDIPSHLPTPGGDFVPHNYDKTYHGPVRLRTALGCSYNVPAVRVASRLGVDNLLKFLRTCGFDNLTRPSADYGLGLTLGNGEVSLMQLTRAYSLFPRLGKPLSLNWTTPIANTGDGFERDSRKIPVAVTGIIGDILSDHDARAPAFGRKSVLDLPFHCGVKTGTTKDYKDNWTIGWAGRFSVGVWVGNFDGSPMHNVSGVTGAGPIFHEIMKAIEKLYGTPSPQKLPAGIVKCRVCPLSGERPGSWCHEAIEELFVWGTEPTHTCSYHGSHGIAYPPEYDAWANENGQSAIAGGNNAGKERQRIRIMYPDHESIFSLDPVLDIAYQTITISVVVPSSVSSVDLFIDEEKKTLTKEPYSFRWRLKKGNHTLKTRASADTAAFSDQITFSVL